MASLSHLKPGEKGRIRVEIDLAGKIGAVTKTVQVFSNDPKRPVVTLTATMRVRDRMHMKTYSATQIFAPPCSGCHVEQGRGKAGFDLFRGDCFMCHNAGTTAMNISQMSGRPEAHIRRVIRGGVEGTSMPGWARKNGGPLTDAEIESLVGIIIKPN